MRQCYESNIRQYYDKSAPQPVSEGGIACMKQGVTRRKASFHFIMTVRLNLFQVIAWRVCLRVTATVAVT